jgi:hypothetical protein
MITYNGWSFERRIGSGDREHVRHLLLNVGFFCHTDMGEQIKGAAAAANSLGMMLRVHLNVDRVTDMAGVYATMHQNAWHQIESWRSLDRPAFDAMFEKLDLLVMGGGRTQVAAEVCIGLLDEWKHHGGRFLDGNFGRPTDDELKLKYPEMYPDSTKYWEAWNA